jgi:hypothetical protein
VHKYIPLAMCSNSVTASRPGDEGPRGDAGIGAQVFHDKSGYGAVAAQANNTLEIDFKNAGRERVTDGFFKLGE